MEFPRLDSLKAKNSTTSLPPLQDHNSFHRMSLTSPLNQLEDAVAQWPGIQEELFPDPAEESKEKGRPPRLKKTETFIKAQRRFVEIRGIEGKSLEAISDEGIKMLEDKMTDKHDLVNVVRKTMDRSVLMKKRDENLYGKSQAKSTIATPNMQMQAAARPGGASRRRSVSMPAGDPISPLPRLAAPCLTDPGFDSPVRRFSFEDDGISPLAPHSTSMQARLKKGKVRYSTMINEQAQAQELVAVADRGYRQMLQGFFDVEDQAWHRLDALTKGQPAPKSDHDPLALLGVRCPSDF